MCPTLISDFPVQTWCRSSCKDSSDLVMSFHVGCYILRPAPTCSSFGSLHHNDFEMKPIRSKYFEVTVCFTIVSFVPLLLALKWEDHIENVHFISNLLRWCIEPKMRIVLIFMDLIGYYDKHFSSLTKYSIFKKLYML